MITNKGLELLGFAALVEGESITAEFHLIRTFCLRGIKLPYDPRTFRYSGTLGKAPHGEYQVLIGNDPEELTREALGDSPMIEQITFTKEKGEAPPYVAIHTGPTMAETATTGYYRRVDSSLFTHDMFAASRMELVRRDRELLQPLVASIPIGFSEHSHPVTVHNLSRIEIGITSDGEAISDGKITLSASAYLSRPVDEAVILKGLAMGPRLHALLRPDLLAFFYMAMTESDPLKEFLYYFLFIERLTHAAFRETCPKPGTIVDPTIPERLRETLKNHPLEYDVAPKSLRPRFIWAARFVWPAITDHEVTTFVRLQKARNDLSHGATTVVPPSLARDARLFATFLTTAWVDGSE